MLTSQGGFGCDLSGHHVANVADLHDVGILTVSGALRAGGGRRSGRWGN